jgi:hypothetical protein
VLLRRFRLASASIAAVPDLCEFVLPSSSVGEGAVALGAQLGLLPLPTIEDFENLISRSVVAGGGSLHR